MYDYSNQLISRKEILTGGPNLSENARAAILIPREYVIDPWSTPLPICIKQSIME